MNTAAQDLLPPIPGLSVWRVLDTRLDFARLLTLWQAWHEMPAHPSVLHLVAFTETPPAAAELHAAATPAQAALAAELTASWVGLLPGMHRLLLDGGQFQLTLCVGERQPLLREQRFEADTVWLDSSQPWDRHSLKALAHCCRRGSVLAGVPAETPLAPALREQGFVVQDGRWRHDPPWATRQRDAARSTPAPVGRCAVIGAGLAGASVAAALARRGWLVDVLDAAAEPAAGASGLPAGLLIPYASANDSPRARLTRAGLRLVRAEAQRLLRAGEDWGPTGVLELRLEGRGGLPPDWPAAGAELSHTVSLSGPEAWRTGLQTEGALWHTQAAWIKPAQLVRAWLAQEGVRFLGNSRVALLRAQGQGWELLDAQGQVLVQADQVVLANALDAPRLLATLDLPLSPVHGMRGVLSWGRHTPALEGVCPPHPVNGSGSFIPGVPVDGHHNWYAGSTYEAMTEPAAPQAEHLQADLDKLRRLLPATAAALAPDYAAGSVRAWEAVRCVSRDRLPLVGPLQEVPQPTLWLSAAMGSRGLSLAMLCAEWLAARLGAEPWPLEASLARALHVRRGH
ncbi:MAG: FAD-dependent 5-carboxymethylaminomethyl-2-thiouridine(34) oxidoreductase MnmC [Pseudomonadota bacterium]